MTPVPTPVLFTATFWRDALERALKSAVQGFAVGAGLLTLGGTLADHAQIVGFPWAAGLSAAGGMALASVISSVLSAPIGSGTASLTRAVEPARGGTL